MSTLQKAKIDALQKVRARLVGMFEAYGQSSGICGRLESLYASGEISWTVCIQLKAYVQKALEGYVWLPLWAEAHGADINDAKPDKDARLHATRLAWIDWMIQCYEEDLAALQKPQPLTLIEITEAQKKGFTLAA